MKYLKFSIISISLVALFCFSSCTKDKEEETKTSATIILKDKNNRVVSGIEVYAYDQSKWTVVGDEPNLATFQSASNDDGIALFDNIYNPVYFSTLNNFTNTFRFSAHYSLNGVNKTKVKAVSFKMGESRTETIILD
jgi:hypothetical protein